MDHQLHTPRAPVEEEVVIPWRGGCRYRERALEFTRKLYPRVTIAECPLGPWSKGLALNAALRSSTADVIVVADADCVTDGLPAAVEAVRQGAAFAIPHRRVIRLSEESTGHYMTTGEVRHPFDRRPYTGMAGGGFVVARREVIASIPPDPRFTGWG